MNCCAVYLFIIAWKGGGINRYKLGHNNSFLYLTYILQAEIEFHFAIYLVYHLFQQNFAL